MRMCTTASANSPANSQVFRTKSEKDGILHQSGHWNQSGGAHAQVKSAEGSIGTHAWASSAQYPCPGPGGQRQLNHLLEHVRISRGLHLRQDRADQVRSCHCPHHAHKVHGGQCEGWQRFTGDYAPQVSGGRPAEEGDCGAFEQARWHASYRLHVLLRLQAIHVAEGHAQDKYLRYTWCLLRKAGTRTVSKRTTSSSWWRSL